jgi:hypothetical protein
MTKEKIFRDFLEDSLITDKLPIPSDKIQKLRFIDSSGSKLIEVIKIAIESEIRGDSDAVISRKINQYLNK